MAKFNVIIHTNGGQQAEFTMNCNSRNDVMDFMHNDEMLIICDNGDGTVDVVPRANVDCYKIRETR